MKHHHHCTSSAVMAETPPHLSELVKLGFRFLIILFLVPLLIIVSLSIRSDPQEIIMELWNSMHFTTLHITCCLLLIISATFLFMSRPRPVYLVDYALFKPPRSYRVSTAKFTKIRMASAGDTAGFRFQMKVLQRSGLGEETCVPPELHNSPPRPNMQLAREEAELVIFSAVDSLFLKTGLKPKDVDILILNCSLFSPTPSLTAMVINKYKMRSNIRSFNLSGMGCSASLIAVDLAKDLLRLYPNSNAVVISTEILTPYHYQGNDKSMLLPICLFRMGGAAVLLSNRRADRRRAKYRLAHLVRTHKGADDKSYRCISQEEDSEGYVGVKLNSELIPVAGEAVKSNITAIGPLVLPASEKLLFALSLVGSKLINSKWKPYIPDFGKAFEHMCIHAGGRAVIDELQKSLRLSDEQVEASRMALHRFGNTSSSTLWYALSYIESKGRMKKGDKVWQIGFGAGFKCNSAVWNCNRTIKSPVDGPWADCIDKYPIYINSSTD